jgi:GT2 family glycosyltransferase
MTAEPPPTTLVIPNWNGKDHLRTCLDSVHAQTLPPSRTILVDNGSEDGSVEFVEQEFPWVECIRIGHNAGFAVAVNRGILAGKDDFVALLNNDTELETSWLQFLAAALGEDRSAGMAACKMLRFEHRDVIDGAGDALTRAGAPYTRGAGEPDDGRYGTGSYVFGACAGAALYRRELFDAIGLFDEDFISYYEDVDLSMRALLAGWKCLYVPEARCYHKRGATSARRPAYPIRMQERNLTALYAKDFPFEVLVRRCPVIAASRIRRTYRAVTAGMGGATFRGIWDGCRILPRMLAKRRAVQRSRTVPATRLMQWMAR